MYDLCYQEFLQFYILRRQEYTQHSFPIMTTNVELDGIKNEIDDTTPKNGLCPSQHSLAASEFEQARHKLFNYAMENFKATIADKKPKYSFNSLKCAAKVNLDLGSILKILKTEYSDTLKHTETIPFGTDPNPCATSRTWQSQKIIFRKLTPSSRTAEKERTQKGILTNWQTELCLLLSSKMYLGVARTLFYPNLCF